MDASTLLRSHRSCDQTEDPEKVVFELLKALSRLSSPASPPSGESLLHWAIELLCEGSPDFDPNNESTDQDLFEWTCGLILFHELIDSDHPKYDEVNISISPQCLLRCIIERCSGYRNEQKFGLTLFNMVCTLLVSEAIRKCHASALHEQKRRWKRTQSMCMEAITLYQTVYFSSIPHSPYKLESLQQLSGLFCDFLSPALCDLLEVFEVAKDFVNGPSEEKVRTIAAGMVNISSTLSIYIAEVPCSSANVNDDTVLKDSLVFDLTKQMLRVPSFRIDFIWLHPLRCAYESSRVKFSHEFDDYNDDEESDKFIEGSAEKRILHQLSSLLCNSSDDIGLTFDSLLGMNVQWNEQALGVMMYAALKEKSSDRTALFPKVYSKQMVFNMMYPYVSILLGLSQRKSTDNERDAAGNDGATPQNIETHMQYYLKMSITLLRYILSLLGDEVVCRHLEVNNSLIPVRVLSPVGTIQLLLNHVINISKTTISNQTPQDDRLSPHDLIEYIRRLLSCYPILIRISSIKKLVRRCPFPFLVPTLFDLLRNSVSSSEFVEVLEMIALIRPFLDEMLSYNSGSDIHSLIDNAETFTSVVSLFRLLWLGRHRITFDEDVNNIMNDLVSYRSILQKIVQKTTMDDDEIPACRVFLLEMALDDLLAIRESLV